MPVRFALLLAKLTILAQTNLDCYRWQKSLSLKHSWRQFSLTLASRHCSILVLSGCPGRPGHIPIARPMRRAGRSARERRSGGAVRASCGINPSQTGFHLALTNSKRGGILQPQEAESIGRFGPTRRDV